MVTKVASLAVVRFGALLLVRKRDTLILPGGKLEGSENPEAALARELREELPGADFEIRNLLHVVEGISPHSKREIEVSVFSGMVRFSNGLKVGAEIEAGYFMSAKQIERIQKDIKDPRSVSEPTLKTLSLLREMERLT